MKVACQTAVRGWPRSTRDALCVVDHNMRDNNSKNWLTFQQIWNRFVSSLKMSDETHLFIVYLRSMNILPPRPNWTMSSSLPRQVVRPKYELSITPKLLLPLKFNNNHYVNVLVRCAYVVLCMICMTGCGISSFITLAFGWGLNHLSRRHYYFFDMNISTVVINILLFAYYCPLIYMHQILYIYQYLQTTK